MLGQLGKLVRSCLRIKKVKRVGDIAQWKGPGSSILSTKKVNQKKKKTTLACNKEILGGWRAFYLRNVILPLPSVLCQTWSFWHLPAPCPLGTTIGEADSQWVQNNRVMSSMRALPGSAQYLAHCQHLLSVNHCYLKKETKFPTLPADHQWCKPIRIPQPICTHPIPWAGKSLLFKLSTPS